MANNQLNINENLTDDLRPDAVPVPGVADQEGERQGVGSPEIIRKPRCQSVQDLLREEIKPEEFAGQAAAFPQGEAHPRPMGGQSTRRGNPSPEVTPPVREMPAMGSQQDPVRANVVRDAGGGAAERPAHAGQKAPVPGVAAHPVPAPLRGELQGHGRNASAGVLLQTHGLVKVYDGRAVVDGVDINVKEREIVGLLGPNGAGKTTSFYMIVGLIQPNGGNVEFGGRDATNEPMYKRARLGMGYLPQEESIFRKLTVEQNIMAVLETQSYSGPERRERCQNLMKRFGIEKLAKNLAITLSGGEKRRLTIARSLVVNPKLLMLDEPFSGVDPIAVGEIQEIICQLREQGLAILITDHNVRETLGIVDRAYLIYEGKVLMEGSRDDLVGNPEARKLYLGERFSM